MSCLVEKNVKKDLIAKNKLIVGLLLTERCNLNCAYCYEKYKRDKDMSLSKAKEIISNVMSTKTVWTVVEFRLLGGEPFVMSDLIYELTAWALSQKWSKAYTFKITTNGTLLDDKMKLWLRNNRKSIQLILSLDGPDYVQNWNRSNSYGKIDFRFFSEVWPEQPVKMTISKRMISEIYNSFIYLNEMLGLKVSYSLAGGEHWTDEDLEKFKEEERKVFEYCTKKHIDIPSLYNFKFSHIMNKKHVVQCGIGRNVIVFDTEGKSYPCHMLLPNVIGKRKIPKISDFRNESLLSDCLCENCLVRNICPTCYAYNFVERGECCKRDHSLCLFYKSVIKSAAFYRMKRYSQQFLFSKDELNEIEAILFWHYT